MCSDVSWRKGYLDPDMQSQYIIKAMTETSNLTIASCSAPVSWTCTWEVSQTSTTAVPTIGTWGCITGVIHWRNKRNLHAGQVWVYIAAHVNEWRMRCSFPSSIYSSAYVCKTWVVRTCCCPDSLGNPLLSRSRSGAGLAWRCRCSRWWIWTCQGTRRRWLVLTDL